MKPANRSSGRSRPRNLDVSSQLELFASLPTPPPAEESIQAEPEPQVETPVPNSLPIGVGTEPDSPDETDFDTALLEAMTTMPEQIPPEETAVSADDETLSQAESEPEDESWSRPDPRPEDRGEVTPAPEPEDRSELNQDPEPEDRGEVTPAPETTRTLENLFDPFESDPFFADNSTPAPASPVTIKRPPRAQIPSAEERLLDTIVSKPAGITEPVDVQAINQTTTERDQAQTRVTALEKELMAMRDQMTKETQLRKADAARFAAAEREWARKSLPVAGGGRSRHGTLEEDAPPRSRAPVIALTVLIVILTTGLGFFAGRSCSSHQKPVEAVSQPAAPAEKAIEAIPPPALPLPPPRVATQPKATAWPVLEGKGFKTTQSGNTLSIRFNYGVFARGTEMTGPACQDLRRIASTLTPSSKQIRIEVVGHTDAAPVSSGRPYAGNHELGLSRAKVVADYLSKQCGLPTDILKVTSAGEANPPYPNTTAESRKLNRTVVLKLTKVSE